MNSSDTRPTEGETPRPDTSGGQKIHPERHAPAHARTRKDSVQRLKSIEGHIRGIQRMVDEDAYCIDILKQIKAVKQALERVGQITLETHLQTCATEGLRSEDAGERDRVIEEIVEVFHATGKL